ncbi:hypothetical protein THF1C08_60038 [Vibrio jasicida]|uniref:Uncharacterized protein n=1 Tax=Vibrio jasicida TaxID=766224 RepID=A0AAU9QPR3_9VIBR|nr:hypothetical protein THF1A12_30196 [Vibrio jasicida]CAH1600185.1 hypothetical protein THF1C08_60038 [Vibrio jasicida]CAH1608939.1 hypothetical protein THF5G08_70268 [Vibrio jasicida]
MGVFLILKLATEIIPAEPLYQ